MERTLTPAEAWEDFYTWVTQPENWAKVDRPGRDQIGKAQRAYAGSTKYRLGTERIKALLGKFASERYEFREIFLLKGK